MILGLHTSSIFFLISIRAIQHAAWIKIPPRFAPQANSSLTSLHLSDNAVGAAGLMALLVKAGRSLTELTLERNIIRGADLIKLLPASEPSDAAAGHTSAAAWSSTSSPLQRLMLANNSLLDAGTQAVCRHLQASCPEFSALDLTGCGVGEEGLSSVLALLAARPRMRELNLEHNRSKHGNL